MTIGNLMLCCLLAIGSFVAVCVTVILRKLTRRIDPASVPACKDCMYVAEAKFPFSHDRYCCLRYLSPVDRHLYPCSEVRDNDKWCGYAGKGFKEKDAVKND